MHVPKNIKKIESVCFVNNGNCRSQKKNQQTEIMHCNTHIIKRGTLPALYSVSPKIRAHLVCEYKLTPE